jgi:prepilin-type processing-associated H-X9-DG protein
MSSALDKIKSDSGQTGGSRGGGSSRGAPDLIEPISYVGNCDTTSPTFWPGVTLFGGRGRWDTPRKLDEVKRPYCFPLLNEADDTKTGAYCFRIFMLVSGLKDPDLSARERYLMHYGGQNVVTNGANWLFADGHAAWHSAASNERLVRCIEYINNDGSQGLAPGIKP